MIVEFDTTEFREWYPKFSVDIVSDVQLEMFFNIATTIINNTESSPYPYDPPKTLFRKLVLYALVCHQATMSTWQNGQAGALTSASQGSVSVGFSSPPQGSKAWYDATPCGQTVIAMLKPYMLGGIVATNNDHHPYG